ncbi:iron-containing alcohol dehydrogenase family protein [Clostridium beijerinckii]|uniref:Iron-containing alcohol dehydrogenase family protein n=2 Tax=Clostridium beijerinckii TaxID=1520 RepID=A0AAW3W9N5_CLOBE|nr:iron-containing alcohol dehydrogenase family protein [Clostridium beijerinckii]MBC2458289.1 iron-containing alcohol dehydrogenase family protein [Clostridium beijerinckii]MBC2475705.1 iron-containing alcohol dehydrogenase family protein [Clostridium beijerinckii]MDG5853379.1 iron-containing alcohol dehydrogenase family protein [Clostridium beijerinckii]NOV61659.1 glycerol-1-phosphate dehydrogenase [NAD(P)+] [Clostridium beijerinckii]NOV68845.1 glycerol-1-phosphate dehydrogenase [NAD(P)+] [C
MKTSTHRIAIPSILEVGKGNINNVGNLIKKAMFKSVLICFGEGLEELFGDSICNSLKEANIDISRIETISDVNFEKISVKAFEISNDVEALIGVGGGKAIDAVKYMSFLRKLPFISIPTSTSNDGFSSAGASLLVNGKRMSLPAKTPYGIIVDIDVIKSAPEKFIYSGIGDLVSNITALYDWKFEEENGRIIIDDFATMISKKAVNSFIRTEFKNIKDDLFLKELVDSLILNGISMEIAGDSSPASGSEHLISHALDKFLEMPQLHGIQVGIATYIMAKVQYHRFERISKILKETNFFEHAKTLKMKKKDYKKAIDIAPSIKPNRYTYIHVDENRILAKKIIDEDEILNYILI